MSRLALIAFALLCAGCSLPVPRNAVTDFFVKDYELPDYDESAANLARSVRDLEGNPGSAAFGGLSGALAGAIVAVDTLTEVGDVLPAVTTDLVPSIADLAATDGARPILLVQAEAAGLVRVVALGALDVVTTATDPISGELRFQSIRPGAIIAHQRASLRAPGAWLALETGGPAEVPGLRAAFDAVPDKLQAPALVR